MIPRIITSDFIKSALSLKDSINDFSSEIVFLGRSNVGKSSTINGLAIRKNLAKSSSTPGKTRLINFFNIEYLYNAEKFYLKFVDLPGFGYAKVSKSIKNEWQKNLVEFIKDRISIRIFIHLRDSRHPNTKIDKEVEEYISEFITGDQLYLNVFTKIDKLNRKEERELKSKFQNSITISNLNNTGYDNIHKIILKHIFDI